MVVVGYHIVEFDMCPNIMKNFTLTTFQSITISAMSSVDIKQKWHPMKNILYQLSLK